MSKGILIGSEKAFSISNDTLDQNASLCCQFSYSAIFHINFYCDRIYFMDRKIEVMTP